MTQEFYVVRCFSCETFQVHQVAKVKKFTCKLCGAKQSVRKVYAVGSGKDCRTCVQKLNSSAQNLQIMEDAATEEQLNSSSLGEELSFCESKSTEPKESLANHSSKWAQFLHDSSEDEDTETGDVRQERPTSSLQKLCDPQTIYGHMYDDYCSSIKQSSRSKHNPKRVFEEIQHEVPYRCKKTLLIKQDTDSSKTRARYFKDVELSVSTSFEKPQLKSFIHYTKSPSSCLSNSESSSSCSWVSPKLCSERSLKNLVKYTDSSVKGSGSTGTQSVIKKGNLNKPVSSTIATDAYSKYSNCEDLDDLLKFTF